MASQSGHEREPARPGQRHQHQPDQLTLGQLSENWDNLVRFHASGDRVPTYALTWIADLLRALGHHAP